MGTRIAQFDALLSGYRDPNTGLPGAGYTVYFYAAGTTTAKDVWTAYDKTGGAVQSVVLDATGSALVFGDGVYKLVVKNLSAATVDTFDGIKVQAGGYNVTTSSAATLDVTVDMDAVLLDCTSTNQIATLPLASTATRPIAFKRIVGGVNTITIAAQGSDTIDGGASYTGLVAQNSDVTFISDGANWYGQNSGTQDADTLGGYAADTAATPSTIPVRTASGGIPGLPGVLLAEQIFTSSGTWTKPAGTTAIEVICVGGGGGGGGVAAVHAAAGGGGGGAYVYSYRTSDISATEAVAIGAAGAGGIGANAGGTGGDTTFGVTKVVAKGGTGGGAGDGTLLTANLYLDGDTGAGGAASGSTGDLKIDGASGGYGIVVTNVYTQASVGGSNPLCPQQVSPSVLTWAGVYGQNGLTGYNYGHGGGGGVNGDVATSRTGGAGAKGLAIVKSYGVTP